MMLCRPELIKQAKEIADFGEDSFFTEFNKRVFGYIVRKYDETEGAFDEVFLSESFDQNEMGRIVKMKIRRMELSDNSADTFKECVKRLIDSTSEKSVTDINELEELIKSKRRKNQ